MQQRHLYVLSTVALAGWLVAPQLARAQTRSPFQVGAQLATLRVGDLGSTNAGVGGHMSFDLRRWVSVEGELNVFPRDTFETDTTSFAVSDLRVVHRRRRLDAFFGPKVGFTRERFGLFASVKPGFSRLTDRGVRCAGRDCAVVLLALPVYRTEFALDVGGVFELYPTARTVLRATVSDTVIRHRSLAPPCDTCSTHNLATRVGIGMRF